MGILPSKQGGKATKNGAVTHFSRKKVIFFFPLSLELDADIMKYGILNNMNILALILKKTTTQSSK